MTPAMPVGARDSVGAAQLLGRAGRQGGERGISGRRGERGRGRSGPWRPRPETRSPTVPGSRPTWAVVTVTRKDVTAPGGCAAGEAGTGQRLLPTGSDTDAQQPSQPVTGSASRCPDTGCARGPTPWDADTPTHPPRHARPRGQLPQAADPASPAPVTPGERGMGVSGRLACHHGRVLWRGRFRFPQFPAARSRGGWLADVPHASLRHLLIRLGVSRTSYANSTSASAHGAGIRPHSPPDTAVTPLTNPHARQQPFSLSLSLEIRLPSARTSQEAERNPRSSHTSPSRP